MTMRLAVVAATAALIGVTSPVAAQQDATTETMRNAIEDLSREVQALREEVRALRAEREALREEMLYLEAAAYGGDGLAPPVNGDLLSEVFTADLEMPELAGLTAIQLAQVHLEPEQRIDYFTWVLREINDPLSMRNAAYLALFEALQAQGATREAAGLLQQMTSENARRWRPDEPWVGERLRAARERDRRLRRPIILFGHPRRYEVYPRPFLHWRHPEHPWLEENERQ